MYWMNDGKEQAKYDDEAEAYEKVLKGIPDECKPIMHDLKIERYYRKW